MFSKLALAFLFLAAVQSVNLRREGDFAEEQVLNHMEADINAAKQLISQSPSQCVTVYSECNFKGESTKVCGGNVEHVGHPILSVKVPTGAGVKIHANVVDVHVNNDIECLKEPIKGEFTVGVAA